jgi:hypothetical protein
MEATALLTDLEAAGIRLHVAGGALRAEPASLLTEAHRAAIRLHKPELLRLLPPANDSDTCPTEGAHSQAPAGGLVHVSHYLVRLVNGERFELHTAPAEPLVEIASRYPGAEVEELPPPAAGGRLSLSDAATIRRWLAHIGEIDQTVTREIMENAAADPAALAYYRARAAEVPPLAAVPSQPPAAAPAEVPCSDCRNWTPDPINPGGGAGLCGAGTGGSAYPWKSCPKGRREVA